METEYEAKRQRRLGEAGSRKMRKRRWERNKADNNRRREREWCACADAKQYNKKLEIEKA